jgi:hypothetical protein
VSLRLLALVWLLACAGSARAGGSLVPVDDAQGWCAKIHDGDCREYFVADDPSLRIVHHGFEDGMRFDLFRRRGRRYAFQLSVDAVRPVAARPGYYARLFYVEGFAPVLDGTGDRIAFRYSFDYTLEDDMGEMLLDRWQKRLPAILFEPATDAKAIDGEPGEALAMQFEILTIRQAIHRSRQARVDCPATDEQVSRCP